MTTNMTTTVVCLDDRREYLDSVLALELEDPGWQLVLAATPAEAREALEAAPPDDLVFIVDHDLNGSEVGYDIVRWARTSLAGGTFLPVVYLTGKQTEADFVSASSETPFEAANVLLSKREVGRRDFDFVQFVKTLLLKSAEARLRSEEQSVRRSLDAIDAGDVLDVGEPA